MFDSHVHFDAYPDALGPWGTPARARALGILGALNPAVDLASSRRALEVHRRHPWIRPGCGVHPLFLGELTEPPAADLEALAKSGAYAAVGEVGLDFGQGRQDEERQRAFFDAQVRIASRAGLPLVLHLRKAFYEGFAVLREAGFAGPVVCHGFTGSRDMAVLALDRGGYLGAGAALLRTGGGRVREVFRWAPRGRVLVETDAPPPTGHPAPGREPWELPTVVEALAETWGMTPQKTAEITNYNAEQLFSGRPGGAG
ncbi:MAG: TatD family hydrolase [Deferrisomatales bacterium]|nr:TatD family hydrolase [Deferrisomatales bacterium]